jgi:hypothetical protein
MAEDKVSGTGVMFIRFYAEQSGIESEFKIIYTALRVLAPTLTGALDVCDDDPLLGPGVRSRAQWD